MDIGNSHLIVGTDRRRNGNFDSLHPLSGIAASFFENLRRIGRRKGDVVDDLGSVISIECWEEAVGCQRQGSEQEEFV